MAAKGKQHVPEFTQRLPIYSLPTQKLMEVSSTPAGMVTPPLHPPASVPFLWEEEPGRPRPWVARASSVARRCLVLDLPPRLLNSNSNGHGKSFRASAFSQGDVGLHDDNSPTSVLIDPYDGGQSAQSPPEFGEAEGDAYGTSRAKALDGGRGGRGGGGKGGGKIDQWLMGLWQRRNWAAKGKKASAAGDEDARFRLVGAGGGDAAADPLSTSASGDGANKAKITRFTRKGSFTTSHFVASVYGSFKQMVSPRRRKPTNSRVPHRPLFLPPSELN
ncbi:unnamed protein product [Victoria cruziana]